MAWPCCGPKTSVRRMSRSSVPCRCAAYSRSLRFRIDIRPEYAYALVECQPERPRMRWRRRPTSDFSEEIRAHIALETDRLIADGMSPNEAAGAARRKFGNVTAATERFHESRRSWWLDAIRQDFRAARRNLIRYPIVAIVAVLSLGAGIGATTASLTIRDVLFQNPPPLYVDPLGLSRIQVNRQDRPIRPVGSYVPADLFAIWEHALGPAVAAAAIREGPGDVRTAD